MPGHGALEEARVEAAGRLDRLRASMADLTTPACPTCVGPDATAGRRRPVDGRSAVVSGS